MGFVLEKSSSRGCENETGVESWTETSSEPLSQKKISQIHKMPRQNLSGSSTEAFCSQPRKPGCPMILICVCGGECGREGRGELTVGRDEEEITDLWKTEEREKCWRAAISAKQTNHQYVQYSDIMQHFLLLRWYKRYWAHSTAVFVVTCVYVLAAGHMCVCSCVRCVCVTYLNWLYDMFDDWSWAWTVVLWWKHHLLQKMTLRSFFFPLQFIQMSFVDTVTPSTRSWVSMVLLTRVH